MRHHLSQNAETARPVWQAQAKLGFHRTLHDFPPSGTAERDCVVHAALIRSSELRKHFICEYAKRLRLVLVGQTKHELGNTEIDEGMEVVHAFLGNAYKTSLARPIFIRLPSHEVGLSLNQRRKRTLVIGQDDLGEVREPQGGRIPADRSAGGVQSFQNLAILQWGWKAENVDVGGVPGSGTQYARTTATNPNGRIWGSWTGLGLQKASLI